MTNVLARDPVGRIPVVGSAGEGPVAVSDVIGVVTRSDVLRALHAGGDHEGGSQGRDSLAEQLGRLGLDDLFGEVQAVAAAYRGAYLVGGAVRDLLLEERVSDIDIAVEGDGIEFARELGARLHGRVRAHQKFQTAVVVVDRAAAASGSVLRVDVASTRTEFYDYPAALPKVEHATIRGDLARRDFSINAMAVSLNPRDFGALLDFFGGLDDLRDKRIRVLHNLSFIEDPTRIFRAVRYEDRYGFRMDRHTLALARACSEMDLIGDLSSARLRDELVLLLDEPRISSTLRRLRELGLQHALHPRLALDDTSASSSRRSTRCGGAASSRAKSPAWRARLVVTAARPRARGARGMGRPHEVPPPRRARARAGLARGHAARAPPGAPPERGRPLRDRPRRAARSAARGDGRGRRRTRRATPLQHLRHSRRVRLAVNGRDLLEMGYRQSADLGAVLHSLLRMKLNGLISGRRQELEAARRMRAADRGARPRDGPTTSEPSPAAAAPRSCATTPADRSGTRRAATAGGPPSPRGWAGSRRRPSTRST